MAMISVDAGQETWYFYHTDALGSVAALSQWNTDTSQVESVERYRYHDVFGRTTVCDANGTPRAVNASAFDNTILFTGRRLDVESGLYDYRARIYSPTLGRFLQTDPLGYIDGMNLYAYVNNNPLNWVDPWGLDKSGGNGGRPSNRQALEVAAGLAAGLVGTALGGPTAGAICAYLGWAFTSGYHSPTDLLPVQHHHKYPPSTPIGMPAFGPGTYPINP